LRVAIATVRVPFLEGGADALAEGLRRAVAARGHPVEIIAMPFRFFPPEEIGRSMDLWQGEDFTRLNYYEPDRVVCLKFPAYAVKHPSKVLWLLHQHRAAYELHDAARASGEEAALRDRIHAFDARHLAAIPRRYTIAARVSERLQSFNGISSAPLYHPTPYAADHYTGRAQPYVFFPSRIEDAKRQALLVRAMAHVRGPGSAVFAGEGRCSSWRSSWECGTACASSAASKRKTSSRSTRGPRRSASPPSMKTWDTSRWKRCCPRSP
jgi:hypothetical protein